MKTIEGKKVIDARRGLDVTIYPSDVKRAGVQNPARCAAAQALCRDPDIAEARVHISRTYVRHKGNVFWERYQTPQQLRTEIVAFDKGAPKAFDVVNTFTLGKPPKPTTGKRQGGPTKPKLKRSWPKERRKYILTNIRPNAQAEWDKPSK